MNYTIHVFSFFSTCQENKLCYNQATQQERREQCSLPGLLGSSAGFSSPVWWPWALACVPHSSRRSNHGRHAAVRGRDRQGGGISGHRRPGRSHVRRDRSALAALQRGRVHGDSLVKSPHNPNEPRNSPKGGAPVPIRCPFLKEDLT